jgi:hypothetical protein
MTAENEPQVPVPDVSPRRLTLDEYLDFTPEKIELIDGDLAPQKEMSDLLASLLTNVGLEKALSFAPLEKWEAALAKVKACQIFPHEE